MPTNELVVVPGWCAACIILLLVAIVLLGAVLRQCGELDDDMTVIRRTVTDLWREDNRRRVGQTNVRPGRVEPPGVRFTPSDRVAGHPAKFYSIVPNDDGTVDVYIPVEWAKYETADGIYDHDLTVSAVRGIVPWEGLEEDIRAHYDDWISSGIRIMF